ncbi:hypothetical protein AAVH_21009 [Aphelenchoides avenae]|nr:hypothetical protein AAVH_21009 [Aphelenchus avenae]
MHLTTTCLLVFAVAVALCSAAEEAPKNIERRDNTGAKQQLEQQLNEAKQPSGMAKDVTRADRVRRGYGYGYGYGGWGGGGWGMRGWGMSPFMGMGMFSPFGMWGR